MKKSLSKIIDLNANKLALVTEKCNKHNHWCEHFHPGIMFDASE